MHDRSKTEVQQADPFLPVWAKDLRLDIWKFPTYFLRCSVRCLCLWGVNPIYCAIMSAYKPIPGAFNRRLKLLNKMVLEYGIKVFISEKPRVW